MPYKYKRVCPICNRREVINLASHLQIVHALETGERTDILKTAVILSSDVLMRPHYRLPPIRRFKVPQTSRVSNVVRKKSPKSKDVPTAVLVTESYPDFIFKHKFSLLVIAPTQSGKTFFVRKLLERDHIEYGNSKPRKMLWYYGQDQPIYREMQRSLGKEIKFVGGLPEFADNLSDLDDTYNNVIVLDDLMDLAKDSSIVAKLFTQGRHRNASVILLLQNAFPNGKYNTDISRNAQYIALWKSPSDRRQIGHLAARIFEKRSTEFMFVYNNVTAEPYQHVLIDCKPETPPNRQLVSDVFGDCKAYPNVIGTDRVVDTTPIRPISTDTVVDTAPIRQVSHRTSAPRRTTNEDKILKLNEERGPIVVNLPKREWLQISAKFEEADSFGNTPAGWNVWRIYVIEARPRDYTYLPVVLKRSNDGETKKYNVSRAYLLDSCYKLKGLF